MTSDSVQSGLLVRARATSRKIFIRSLSTIVLPLTITGTALISAHEHGPVRVYWSIGTVVAVVLTGIISYTRERNTATLKAQAIELRADLATALNNTGVPLITALGKVAECNTPDTVKGALEVLIERSVSLAQTEIGRHEPHDIGGVQQPCKTRATFYLFDGQKLTRRNFAGWAGAQAPRLEWDFERSEHEAEVIKFARGEDARLVRNLATEPPPHFMDIGGRSYKSFVAVPVRVGNKSFGLLTADADRAYALNHVDRGFLILLAGVLGAGLAHAEVVESKAGQSGQFLDLH
jgi:hypothetical protein